MDWQKGAPRRKTKTKSGLRQNFGFCRLLVMVCPGGKIRVSEHGKRWNSDDCIKCFGELSAKLGRKAHGKKRLYQDNDRVQNSKKTWAFLKTRGYYTLAENDVPIPPYSPDLNPLDAAVFSSLRLLLRDSVIARCPKSAKEFDARVKEVLTSNELARRTRKFVSNYKKRLQLVVENKGFLV
jgi:hypothetical protein